MIIFRCDSSFEIGTGHIMRDLVLANSLRKMGLQTCFVCRDLKGNIAAFVRDSGFELHLLPQNLSTDDEISSIKALNPSWVVVDHYGLAESWEIKLKGFCKLMVIDDLGDRPHFADVIIDQNFHRKTDLYNHLQSGGVRRYIGPQFALLRESLVCASDSHEKTDLVICFFGGTDYTGESLKLIEELQKSKTNFQYVVVVGRNNVNIEQILKIRPAHFRILVAPTDWDKLLATAKFFFGSGGTVTWERMYLEVPGAVVSVAENQRKIAEDLALEGYQYYFGHFSDVNYSECLSRLEALLSNDPELARVADRAKSIVRPFPTSILRMLFEPIGQMDFQIKAAGPEHSEFLFQLRNDPLSVKMFKSQKAVTRKEHEDWLSKKLQDSESRLYVVYLDSKPSAQFRVDADGFTSVSVVAEFRGRGLAARVIKESSALYFCEKPEVQKLKAEVKIENQGSVRAFSTAGYSFDGAFKADEGYHILSLVNGSVK